MIEELKPTIHEESAISTINYPPSSFEMMEKINEIIGVVNRLENEFQGLANYIVRGE